MSLGTSGVAQITKLARMNGRPFLVYVYVATADDRSKHSLTNGFVVLEGGGME